MRNELGNIHVACTLLGPSADEIYFNESGHQSSALPNSLGQSFGRTLKTRMSTLDALITEFGLPWPNLIKLDLQGFEIEALKGAIQCLAHADALLLEVSFFKLQRGAPIADEVISYARNNRFHIYDIPALWHRPLDGALAGGDFLFLREGHPLFADNSWSADTTFS